ncbi:SDR family oxidoreductase, partial [Klebsiella pneumoniae]|uniref:SDR family oxidoreductase n=1 Tax=Klebsiella pneumoniae TaxID=573 RepID=UPI0027319C02
MQQAYDRVCADVPLRRAAQADEIAKVCRFLASSDASIITGATLVADGGSSIVDVPTLAFTRLEPVFAEMVSDIHEKQLSN